MKKLINWLKWIDNNLIHIFLSVFIFFIPLYPKLPFSHVEYTYISIRLEDLFIAVFYAVTFIQLLRKKFSLKPKFLILFILFWISVMISYVVGFYFQNTIRINQVGLLHALRRIEYMSVFFIAFSLIDSKQRFFYYLKLFFASVLLIGLYGIGQRFLGFPAVQTMNPAFARGLILYLTPEARISSTFGGHFDLAAFSVFAIPLLLGYFLFSNKKIYFGLFTLTLVILLYTASRISFIAYVVTATLFLLLNKKWRLWILVALLSAILLYVTGDLSKRFLQTIQIKQVFVNEQTGGQTINQKINPKELPAGGFEIPGLSAKNKKNTPEEQKKLEQQIMILAQNQALQEAQDQGKVLTQVELQKRTQQIASLINPKNKILCDISCATRLQVEWPRAVAAFTYNPFFGAGPSSITEATDNDYLRWLGEFGLVGTLLFLTIIFAITKYVFKSIKKFSTGEKYILGGFIFGLLALLMNAVYIDVFEASKVAYMFWLIAGFFVGFAHLNYENKRK